MDKVLGFFTGVKEKFTNTGFEWFNFDQGDGFTGILLFIVNIFFTLVTIAIIIFLFFIMGRYILRYLYNKFRNMAVGKMVWSEVEYEGLIGDNELSNSTSQMNNMANIMSPNMGGVTFNFFYVQRPKMAVMIRLKPNDEKAYMYIGMSKKHYDPDMLNNWAAGANCSVEPVDISDLDICTRAPVTLVNNDYDTANITDSPLNSTVGGVISRLQNNSAKETGATVVITYEPTRPEEEMLLKSHILGSQIKESGQSAQLNMAPRNVEIMNSKSPSRGTITAFSDDGNVAVSRSVLSTVQANIPALGVRSTITSFEEIHRRSGVLSLIPVIPLCILGWVGFLPWYIPLAMFIFCMCTIFGASFLSGQWVSKAAAVDGSLPIPPFIRFSFRRLFKQWWMSINKLDLDTNQLGRKYVAEPSYREVIPFYQTSLMQFASMPINGAGVSSISTSAVPQVPMSSTVNKDPAMAAAIDSGDVVFMGTSVKNFEPVFKTVKDLNFGTAFGGNAGTGKTQAMMSVYLGVSHLSRKSHEYTLNPIWFETKSSDLNDLIDKVKPYNPLVSVVHNQGLPQRLCLEGRRFADKGVTMDEIMKNKNNLISAMEQLWGAGSFGHQSKVIADAALTVAYLLRKQDLERLQFDTRLHNPQRPNIIQLASLLVGSDPSINLVAGSTRNPEGLLVDFADKIRSVVLDHTKMSMIQAKGGENMVQWFKTMIGSLDILINMHLKNGATDPLKNKLPQLAKSGGLWETTTKDGTPRKEFGLDKWINYGGPVIADFTAQHSTISDDESLNFTMLIHYMLWQKIQEVCPNWGPQGKFIPIFADEVTKLVGSASDTETKLGGLLGKMADLGRSYGVSHTVGFQRFDQLSRDTASAIKSFRSRVYFSMRQEEDRKAIMGDIGERSRITSDAIRSFPNGYGIANLSINGKFVPHFMVKYPLFDDFAAQLQHTGDPHEAYKQLLADEREKMELDKKKKIDDAEDANNVSLDLVDSHNDGHHAGHDDADDDGIAHLTWG